MQKLVTIYLDNQHHYQQSGWKTGQRDETVPRVEEHLEDHLAAGWKIKSVETFCSGGASHIYVRGWITVLLERDE